MDTLKFTLKDLIYIITIVLSVAGMYYTTKSKIENNEKEIIELKAELKNNNLSLISYRLDELCKQLDKIYDAIK